MKKILVLAILSLTVCLAGCGSSTTNNQEVQSNTTVEESSNDTSSQEIEQAEDTAPDTSSNETAETKDTAPKTADAPKEKEIFEDEGSNDYTNGELSNIYAGANQWPFICYTIGSEEKRIDFEMYKDYGMPEYDINLQKKDLTGDGNIEIIFSVHIFGNDISDLLGDTYVFGLNEDKTEFEQLLYVESEGGNEYINGYKFHVGAVPENGKLRLDFCPGKPEGEEPLEIKSVYLTYDNGKWNKN